MKHSWWLEIALKSDLCAATGNGIEGLVDIETAQEHGLPVIPAKRIKGCLLDSGKELLDHGFVRREVVNHLFGQPGHSISSKLHVESGYLYQVPGAFLEQEEILTLEDYELIQKELEYQNDLNIQMILSTFTRLRTRTAMDINGVAEGGTLRTMRVVKKGLVFRARLEVDGDLDVEEYQLLEWCVKGTRHIGLGVTRGFGEVTCCLIPMEEKRIIPAIHLSQNIEKEEKVRLNYNIELLEPVLLAGKKGLYEDCEDWITGSSIKGAIAAMFIEERRLSGNLHEDKNFNRLFISEGITFGYGFFQQDENVYYPCPASLVRSKGGDPLIENKVTFDRLYDTDTTKRVKEIHSLVSISNDGIYLSSPKKEMRMHHARPTDRGIGHALGDRTGDRKDMGQFYQYVSLAKGQKFSGRWLGKNEDIQLLLQYLEKRNGRLRIGRSRTAEYGAIRFTPEAISKVDLYTNNDEVSNHWIIHFLTPMVLFNNKSLRTEANPECLLYDWDQKGVKAEIKTAFLKFTRIGGYNSRWKLPEGQSPALAEGTVLEVVTNELVSRSWFEDQHFGLMTGSGLGMVRATIYNSNKKEIPILKKESILEQQAVKNPFIIKLKEFSQKCKTKRGDYLEGLKTENYKVLYPSAIEYVISVVENIKDYSYEKVLEEVQKIKNKEKRDEIKYFLSPCKNKSKDFIMAYLEKEKWEARDGGR